jgi:hypothetical protein
MYEYRNLLNDTHREYLGKREAGESAYCCYKMNQQMTNYGDFGWHNENGTRALQNHTHTAVGIFSIAKINR